MGGFHKARRARSTLTLSSQRSTIDDIIDPHVHSHAITAANVAFDRRQDRRQRADASNDSTNLLNRKQSVRFTGPDAQPLTRTITRRYVDSRSNPSARRSESLFTALPQIETVPYTPSIKKLRKAQSMLNTRRIPSGSIFTDPALSTGSSPYTTPSGNRNELTAINLAREDYMRKLTGQPFGQQSSTTTSKTRHKVPKAFRRTVRSSSTTSYGDAIASAPVSKKESSKPGSLGLKAREMSYSVKSTLKRVFTRDSKPTSTFPNQQVEARRIYFGDYIAGSSGVDLQDPDLPTSVYEARQDNSFEKVPIISSPIAMHELHRPGSIKSENTQELDNQVKSRVTSWEDSGDDNTLRRPNLIEKKRLSVIQENGSPYQPSSSAGQVGHMFKKGYAAFKRPLRTHNSRSYTPVDSKRLFSALQKQMEQQRQQIPDQEDYIQTLWEDQMDNNYYDYDHAEQDNNQRVNHAHEHSSHDSPDVECIQDSSRVFDGFSNIYSSSMEDMNANQLQTSFESQLPSVALIPVDHVRLAEEKNNPVPRPLALREVKSSFFSATTIVPSRSSSPYRRAMRESMSREDSASVDSASIYSKQINSSTNIDTSQPVSEEYGTAFISSPISLSTTRSPEKDIDRCGLRRSPAVRHKRENAQLFEGEDDIDFLKQYQSSSLFQPQPFANIDFTTATFRSPLRERLASSTNKLTNVMEQQDNRCATNDVPDSCDGRNSHNDENNSNNSSTNKVYRFSNNDSEPGSPVPIFRPGFSKLRTRSASSLRRYSPERAARLRRMQSSALREGKENMGPAVNDSKTQEAEGKDNNEDQQQQYHHKDRDTSSPRSSDQSENPEDELPAVPYRGSNKSREGSPHHRLQQQQRRNQQLLPKEINSSPITYSGNQNARNGAASPLTGLTDSDSMVRTFLEKRQNAWKNVDNGMAFL